MPVLPDFRRSLPLAIWRAFPALVMLLLLAPAALPAYGSALPLILPPFSLMAACYFALQSGRPFPLGVALALGFATDAVSMMPLGLNAILWLGFRELLLKLRAAVHEEGFVLSWLVEALLLALYLGVQWLAMSLLSTRAYPYAAVFLQWALAVLLYPVLHTALYRLERGFHRRWWFLLKGSA